MQWRIRKGKHGGYFAEYGKACVLGNDPKTSMTIFSAARIIPCKTLDEATRFVEKERSRQYYDI